MAWQGTIVFFDLETTGLDTKSCHIVQLAASCKNTFNHENTFTRYILPHIPIRLGATNVNGFTFRYGQLFLHKEPVSTMTLYYSLTTFINYLGRFPRPVLLAAHSSKIFHGRVLMRVLKKCSLFEQFKKVVSGFVDTLPLSRKLYPQLKDFNWQDLVQRFPFEGKYNAHNAVEKAELLEVLFNYWDPDNDDIEDVTDWI
ncbi:DNA polymerase III PolC-type-like isoform X2 [Trematomus bernacchii]|uniref:DNA polymerase III PolC-type-like isoform X2 n=1 Tax=Trematomus bernacchii TaxID=40690 RepID=UPI00146CF196|nr:DNA polymerase III PolC-type-like isoform X2 [Trematomus bernacchii]